MKRKLITLLTLIFVLSLLAGCGTNSSEAKSTEVVTETEETAEPTETEIHEHMYVNEVTTEATCEADGVITFTCECGDSYTEAVYAKGHVYENYVYNEDATYLADGTETAVCNGCELTDTRTAEGSKLEYTYTEMSTTKYAKQSVNVRNLPSTDGEKLGGLSTNQEVTVTGQCNETSWYRIEYNGEVAYVSHNYLVDEKVEVQTAPVASAENPYPLYEVIDEGGNTVYFYYLWDGVTMKKDQTFWDCYNACREILLARNPGKTGGGAGAEFTGYYVDGLKVMKSTPGVF